MRYLADHMGSNIITSAQVLICVYWFIFVLYFHKSVTFMYKKLIMLSIQGEELRKQIGAAAYIECSSKTQQVELKPKFWGFFMSNLFKGYSRI